VDRLSLSLELYLFEHLLVELLIDAWILEDVLLKEKKPHFADGLHLFLNNIILI
jgi:hypothetical protein